MATRASLSSSKSSDLFPQPDIITGFTCQGDLSISGDGWADRRLEYYLIRKFFERGRCIVTAAHSLVSTLSRGGLWEILDKSQLLSLPDSILVSRVGHGA